MRSARVHKRTRLRTFLPLFGPVPEREMRVRGGLLLGLTLSLVSYGCSEPPAVMDDLRAPLPPEEVVLAPEVVVLDPPRPDAEDPFDAPNDVDAPPPPAVPAEPLCPPGWASLVVDGLGERCAPPEDWSPVRWPCSAGWHRRLDDGIETCEPYSPQGRAQCPPNEVHFPGEEGCLPIGTACGTGEFAENLPTDRPILYVRQSGPPGDGSREAPLSSLDRVPFSELPPGTVVALARGDYSGQWMLNREVILWGACVEGTRLSSPEPLPAGFSFSSLEPAGTLSIRGQPVTLRNLSLGATPRFPLDVRGSRSRVQLQGVRIEVNSNLGVMVRSGARLDGYRVVLDKLGSEHVTLMSVENADTITLRKGVVSGGVFRVTDSRVRMQDITFDRFGGFVGKGDAELSIERSLFEGGVPRIAADEVVLRDAIFREANGDGDAAVDLINVRRTAIERLLVEHSEGPALTLGARLGDRAVLNGVVIRDTGRACRSASSLRLGKGSLVEIRGLAMIRTHGIALQAGGRVGSAHVVDALVRDTQPCPSLGDLGIALVLEGGRQDTFENLLVERSRGLGVLVAGRNAVTLRDFVVRDTLCSSSEDTLCRGIDVQQGSRLYMNDGLVDSMREVGILVDSATVSADGLIVDRTTRPECGPDCDPSAHALVSRGTGRAALVRSALIRSELCAVLVSEQGDVELDRSSLVENGWAGCIQREGFDADRLLRTTDLTNNVVGVEATNHTVPEPLSWE